MADVVLSAAEHFEALREAVWVRHCARHRGFDRDRFDDAYAEWWARELEREARGEPSRASAPAAYVAEAVQRVLVDDARARARGLARDEKHTLELVDIDERLDASGDDDTAGAAAYQALAHRILTLVRGALSTRELRVFVWSFLYLQPSERTAQALGLSVPRVKKDRKRIATKVGAEVWAVLSGELDLCAAYREQSLPAIFEILTVHAEDCPECRSALGEVRRGALALIGPELLVLAAIDDRSGHGLAGVLHGLAARIGTVPHGGRIAAAAAVAAAGTAAVVVPAPPGHDGDRGVPREVRAAATATAVPTTPPPPAPIVDEPRKRRPPARARRPARVAPPAEATPAPAATAPAPPPPSPPSPSPPAPAPTTVPASVPPASAPSAPPPPPPPPAGEFSFERG